MAIFRKPAFAAFLLGLFVAAGLIGGPANGLESNLMRNLAAIRGDWPGMTRLMAIITTLGGAYVTLALASAASLWLLLLRRSLAQALLLAATVLVERSLAEGLKGWIGRPRPHFGLEWLPDSLAFPSGHSANSMTAFLATALIVAPSAFRRPAAIAAIALSVLVGLSRIYLGVHWPSDVIGGWSFGLLAVTAALAIGERSGALSFEPQHKVIGRHRLARGEGETP